MNVKPPVSPSSQAERLIEHARKISQELYKFSVELSEQNREKAQQKINYGKQVLNSLEQLPTKYFNSPDAGSNFLNVVYINYISVKPNLENALIDLQKRIDENQYFKIPEAELDTDKEEKKKPIENDWKSPQELGDEHYSSFLKDLIHAAEKEIEGLNNNNADENEEEAEEESEAESETESEEEGSNKENQEQKEDN